MAEQSGPRILAEDSDESDSPTTKPTKSPTDKPTKFPTAKPTKSPTTKKPTKQPTGSCAILSKEKKCEKDEEFDCWWGKLEKKDGKKEKNNKCHTMSEHCASLNEKKCKKEKKKKCLYLDEEKACYDVPAYDA